MRQRDSILLGFSLLFLVLVLAGGIWLNRQRDKEMVLLNSDLASSGEKASRPLQGAVLSPAAILKAAQPWLSRPEFQRTRIGIYYIHLAPLTGWHDTNIDGRNLYDVVAVGTVFSSYGLPFGIYRHFHEIHRVDLFYDPNTAALREVRFQPSTRAWP